jgi:FeS assembly SUF system regulator
MFRLNRLTDYAVVVMAQMATHPGGVTTAAQVARETGVPLPTVAKLMTALARAGVASSQRGVAGGYTLSRPAAMISVAEIIAAIEGPIALTACVEDATEHCDVESICPMRGNWNKVNRAIRRALEELSLADMMPAPWFPLAPPRDAPAKQPIGGAS